MKKPADIAHLKNWALWRFPEFAQLKVGVLRRSMILGLIIGSALTLINQFEALFGSETIQILPLALMYMTPFAVITISQITAIRQAWLNGKAEQAARKSETFLATIMAYGIPVRGVKISLIVGSFNSALILLEGYSNTAGIVAVPIGLFVQVYALPIVFGVFSQAIAYRRAVKMLNTADV